MTQETQQPYRDRPRATESGVRPRAEMPTQRDQKKRAPGDDLRSTALSHLLDRPCVERWDGEKTRADGDTVTVTPFVRKDRDGRNRNKESLVFAISTENKQVEGAREVKKKKVGCFNMTDCRIFSCWRERKGFANKMTRRLALFPLRRRLFYPP